ncbi:MAG: MBL fold metallo-hydrolase [Capsulimonadales bacterium]|nr:MBL fold metallo-hydrolase [Capsulimonadales bacterium]
MRLFFLGTGAAEGLPALFCECAICREAKSRGGVEVRTRSTILIDDMIKIDLPPDTLHHVHRYPEMELSKLQHLLFTHSHDDHFAVRELQYLSPIFALTRKEPLNVYATGEVIAKMLREMEHFFERAPIRFQSVIPYNEFAVGHLRVTPIVAHHREDELCLNYILSDGRKSVLYGCDTGWYDLPTWEFLERCRLDAVIMECGKGKVRGGYDGHLNVDEVFRMRCCLLEAGVLSEDAPFYLTHISHTGLLLHEEMDRLVRPHGVRVAYDGMKVEI